MQLYENIRKRRIELGLTQEDLASRMGYASRSSVAKIEKGVSDIPQSKIVAFAEALSTTPGALMGLRKNEELKPEPKKDLLDVLFDDKPDILKAIRKLDIYNIKIDEQNKLLIQQAILLALRKHKLQ